MKNMESNVSSIDQWKRAKVLLLSFLISIFSLYYKLTNDSTDFISLAILSLIIFMATYIGMLLIIKKDINKYSLLINIPQAALITTLFVIFGELFFVLRLDRIYEIILFVTYTFIQFFAIYSSILMCNIFSLNQIISIPLVQVARTSSVILSVFALYQAVFISFSLQTNVLVLLISIILLTIIIAFFHVKNLEYDGFLYKKVFPALVINVIGITIPFIFFENRVELIAILPAITFFIIQDWASHIQINRLTKYNYIEYLLIFFSSILGVLFL